MSQDGQDSFYDDDPEAAQVVAAERAALRKPQVDIENADFVWLMSGRRGRRFIWHLLRRARFFKTTFSQSHGEMCRQEGMKQWGYWLIDQIRKLCPDLELEMIKENNHDRAGTGNRS